MMKLLTIDIVLGVFGLIRKVSAHFLLNLRKVALSCMQDILTNEWFDTGMKVYADTSIYLVGSDDRLLLYL